MPSGQIFLYPSSIPQYPFDAVVSAIIREFQARDWQVPGHSVAYDFIKSGPAEYQVVRAITGPQFCLKFYRHQGALGDVSNTAGVTELAIPTMWLQVGHDESMCLRVYETNDGWRHSDAPYKEYTHSTPTLVNFAPQQPSRPPLLVRMPTANGGNHSAHTLVAAEVLSQFTTWFTNNVLALLRCQPKPSSETLPFPVDLGPLYCFGSEKEARRVHAGQPDLLVPDMCEHYGLVPNYRLATGARDGSLLASMCQVYRWCAFGGAQPGVRPRPVPGMHKSHSDDAYVFCITPKNATGVYVANQAAYTQLQNQLFAQLEPYQGLTDSQVDNVDAARAATMVPITDYQPGLFEDPVVLIVRPLEFDEVALVSGPWPECEYITALRTSEEGSDILEELLLAANMHNEQPSGESRIRYNIATSAFFRYLTANQELMEKARQDGTRLDKVIFAVSTMAKLGL